MSLTRCMAGGLQHHPRDGAAGGTVRTVARRCAISGRAADRRDRGRAGRGTAGARRLDYEAGYPATVNHADQVEPSPPSRARSSGQAQGRPRCHARDGGRGFLLHAEARPGAFYFIGQRGSGPGPSPRVRFQRRDRAAGRVVLIARLDRDIAQEHKETGHGRHQSDRGLAEEMKPGGGISTCTPSWAAIATRRPPSSSRPEGLRHRRDQHGLGRERRRGRDRGAARGR